MAKLRTWGSIAAAVSQSYTCPSYTNGPTNAHSKERLFGQGGRGAGEPAVVLYRDNHAWCPYCQKVWLFLEEKRIPYRVEKVSMFCYGDKEAWYKKLVPSGMLPAVHIEGVGLVTESDDVLAALETLSGPLGQPLFDREVVFNRKLERKLFSAWCQWLCSSDDTRSRKRFVSACTDVSRRISDTPSPYLLGEFGVSDVVLAPFIERMAASLYYYKGFDLRADFPQLHAWFSAMEGREAYRGTRSDYHTHAHDMPPQLGGCHFAPQTPAGDACISLVNARSGATFATAAAVEVDSAAWPDTPGAVLEAVHRTAKHHERLAAMSPAGKAACDAMLRMCLTRMLAGVLPAGEGEGEDMPAGAPLPAMVEAARFLRDRISVPRDMTLWAGLHLRTALEDTAQELEQMHGGAIAYQHPIPQKHRRDVNPLRFAGSL